MLVLNNKHYMKNTRRTEKINDFVVTPQFRCLKVVYEYHLRNCQISTGSSSTFIILELGSGNKQRVEEGVFLKVRQMSLCV